MGERSRLLTFVDGVELGHLRAILPHDEIDKRATAMAMEQPMDVLEQGRIRLIICNTTTTMEDVATWIAIHSKQEGGIASGTYKEGTIEEINLVEMKKHLDLTYQMAEAKRERKRKLAIERAREDWGNMSDSQRDTVKKIFKGEEVEDD